MHKIHDTIFKVYNHIPNFLNKSANFYGSLKLVTAEPRCKTTTET
jgi:hypothetical protein